MLSLSSSFLKRKRDENSSSPQSDDKFESSEVIEDVGNRLESLKRSYERLSGMAKDFQSVVDEIGENIAVLEFSMTSGKYPKIEALAPSTPSSATTTLTSHVDVRVKKVESFTRCFSRKPRCLLKLPLSDNFLTSSLDGHIQLWSSGYKKIMSSSLVCIDSWVEDMRLTASSNKHSYGMLALVHVADKDQNISSQILTKRTSVKNVDELISQPFVKITRNPHDKPISCIEILESDPNNGDLCFATGSSDKKIHLWKRPSDETNITIKTSHTAAIQTLLCFGGNAEKLFSGGADSRVLSFDLNAGKQNDSSSPTSKLSGRVSNLKEIPGSGNSILASLCLRDSQLQVLDVRTLGVTQTFGCKERENLSRYVSPAVHSNGWLVAMGSSSQSPSIVNFWDLRMIKDGCSTVHSHIISETAKKILKVEFISKNTVVAMSSDSSMYFLDCN